MNTDLNRRSFLNLGTCGLGATAFAHLLHAESHRQPVRPVAKRAINI